MKPIERNEIPREIIDFTGVVKEIGFPRQGHTSDVGIIDSEKGKFVIKITKGRRFCSWLAQEVFILRCLTKTDLPVPKLYTNVEQES